MGFHILCVDDNFDMAAIIADILSIKGYDVTVRTDSQKALVEVANNMCVDLVLVENNMPDVNGLELCKSIKQDHPHMPIIMMSSDELDYDNLIKEGIISEFIKKPFRINQLLKKVNQVIGAFFNGTSISSSKSHIV